MIRLPLSYGLNKESFYFMTILSVRRRNKHITQCGISNRWKKWKIGNIPTKYITIISQLQKKAE